METCSICFEKRRQEQFVRTECGCAACSDCHLHWVRSQLESKAKVVLRCPMPQCMAPLTTSDILRTLDEDTQEQLEEAQTWSLLRSSPDIKTCPICNYLGFISPSQRSYHCESCNKCWQEPVTPWYAPLRSASAFSLDLMSQVWKRFFCKQCPSCSAFIQKNEGCKHMECLQCGYEFCWLCYIDWRSHTEKVCSGMVYGVYTAIIYVVFALFILKVLSIYTNFTELLLTCLWYPAILAGIGFNGFLVWLVLDMTIDFILTRTRLQLYPRYQSLRRWQVFTAIILQVLVQWLVLLLVRSTTWMLVSVIGSYGAILGCVIEQAIARRRA